MKKLNLLCILSTLLIMFGCAKDVVDTTGTVEGIVKDNSTSTPLQGVSITLSPSGATATTGTDGHYSFPELEAGNYSVEFSKMGYENNKKEISIVSGKTIQVDVMMSKITKGLIANPISLNFGDLETTKSLFISCVAQLGSLRYSIENNTEWITVNKSEGTATTDGDKVTVIIDRSKLLTGNYEKEITFTSNYGNLAVPIIVSQVEKSKPYVTISEPEKVTESTVTIKGTIVKTGGLQITRHGHCWSETESPTVNNSKNNIGSTEQVGEFTSVLTDVVAGKTYYIRAFAENSKGISYSEQVAVTIPIIKKATVNTLAASAVDKTSATLNGTITNNGNGTIKECGFYWGTTETPDKKVAATTADNIVYTLTDLQPDVTYYYKAYAINEKGESCGEVQEFKTLKKDIVVSGPWDGTVADSFGGGDGSYVDPYLIKNPAQLAYLAAVGGENGCYYKLLSNIDLNNKPWKPIVGSSYYSGNNINFDGNGMTISNLYINREQDYLGLFGEASGTISNVNIVNVNIQNSQLSYIGALVGEASSLIIENCNVDLGNGKLVGNSYVGGIAGYVSSCTINNCSVVSNNSGAAILGNSYVGGIMGDSYSSSSTNNCKAKVNISGEKYIGGIIGSNYSSSTIKQCSYIGKLTGSSYIGGITGSINSGNITSSKSECEITATNGYAGGIVGQGGKAGYNLNIRACYSSVVFVKAVEFTGGICGKYRNSTIDCCYSVVKCNDGNVAGLTGGVEQYTNCSAKNSATTADKTHSTGSITTEFVKTDCTNNDIVTHFQESFSTLLSHWNLNNTWTWSDGEKSVVCPRLSWEE